MSLIPIRRRKTSKTPHLTGSNSRPVRDFSTIMADTTHDMPRQKQLFSNLIHSKPISSISDLLGKTIARPNAILFGAVLSFTVTIGVYLLSKNLGYSVSGFESIGSFLVGWAAGILFDLLAPILKRK